MHMGQDQWLELEPAWPAPAVAPAPSASTRAMLP